MADVLVTGGTGVLGSYLVPRLVARGHDVRVLSRRPWAEVPAGATGWQGDVLTGEGLAEAVRGTDAIIHAATSPRRRAKRTEVDGTRRMVAEARAADAHLIYVSIVGVDRVGFPYYRAKLAAEQIVEAEGDRWTIQRATQFHDLLDMALRRRVFAGTHKMPFQPVDAGEVADRLVDLLDAGPCGRAQDFGGPETLAIGDIALARRRVTGKRTFVVRLPPVGFLRDFAAGGHLCPDQADGKIAWEDWLRARTS